MTTRLVALGDSVTAGLGDPVPGGGWRGYAAILAGALVDPARHPALYERRMWGIDRLHPSERGHRLLARLIATELAARGVPLDAMPDAEPTGANPSAWASARWMAVEGTGWVVRRSRDFLPELARLVLSEAWHDVRGRAALLDQRFHTDLDLALRHLGARPLMTGPRRTPSPSPHVATEDACP